MQRIAFIGLGAMGRPMARNLLRAGFKVRGFDLEPRRPRGFGGGRRHPRRLRARGLHRRRRHRVDGRQRRPGGGCALRRGRARSRSGRSHRLPDGDLSAEAGGSDRGACRGGRPPLRRLPGFGRRRGRDDGEPHRHGGSARGSLRGRAPGAGGHRQPHAPRRRSPRARGDGQDRQPAPLRRPHRRGGRGALARGAHRRRYRPGCSRS